VKAFLHTGENTVAVPVASHAREDTGMSRGVSLRFQDAPPPVHWARSVFNGLAEVIVQSTKEPGTIMLTARSDGLQASSFRLASRPAAARPSIP
jgi:beta-galactosidase